MKKATIEKINNELNQRLRILGELEYSELKALDGHPTMESALIDGKSFEITSWSERAVEEPEGVIAVLVDTWRSNFVSGNRFMKGFLIGESGYIRELEENELWEYD